MLLNQPESKAIPEPVVTTKDAGISNLAFAPKIIPAEFIISKLELPPVTWIRPLIIEASPPVTRVRIFLIFGLEIKLTIWFSSTLNLSKLWKRLVLSFDCFPPVISKRVWEESGDGVTGVTTVLVEFASGTIDWADAILAEKIFHGIFPNLPLFSLL